MSLVTHFLPACAVALLPVARYRDAGGRGVAIRFVAIRFKINEDGKRVAVVDTVRNFEEAIETLDCPIIAPAEIAAIYGIEEVFESAEWDHVCQEEEDRWTSLPRGEQ